ncbi:MAG: hypothetical protein WAZ30_11080, partial [Syntrophorhabdus sp.]
CHLVEGTRIFACVLFVVLVKTNNAGRPLMTKPFLSCGNLNPHTAWLWQVKQTLLYGQRSGC